MVLKAAPGQSTAGFSGSLDLLFKVIFRAEAASKNVKGVKEKRKDKVTKGEERKGKAL